MTNLGHPPDVSTRLVRVGSDPQRFDGVINPPLYRASTVLYDNLADMKMRMDKRAEFLPVTTYGRVGTPTTFALEDAFAQIENADRCLLYPSGLAAACAALFAFIKAGDHVLMTASAFRPARAAAAQFFPRYGVELELFDPKIGVGIANLMRSNTRFVYLESPGSDSFEVQDVPAISEIAHRQGALVVLDNTWATPLYFKPFAHGVDISIHAGTKYVIGHADALIGLINCREELYSELRQYTLSMGLCAGPEEAYLALRGLRTLAVRLQQHQTSALEVAKWCAQRPEIEVVLYPALPGAPGHEIWKRDFLGASGLFTLVFKPFVQEKFSAMVDSLNLFGLGFSWGGYESLQMPLSIRGRTHWPYDGPSLRIHIGLEASVDLIADLDQAFQHLNT